MFPKIQTSRFRLAAVVAVIATLVFAASAGAVVYLYSNGFGSHGAYGQIKQLGGGKKVCKEKYLAQPDLMSVTFKGKRLCVYAPPLEADGDQPDHEVIVRASFKRNSARRRAQKATYLAARVRAGGAKGYELRVHPATKKFQIYRNGEAGGLPGGSDRAISPLGKVNSLRLRVSGRVITAFVNNVKVGRFKDPNPDGVTGRRVNFGPGFSQNVPAGPIALIERVQVGVPNP